jgi:hypothetical protein
MINAVSGPGVTMSTTATAIHAAKRASKGIVI